MSDQSENMENRELHHRIATQQQKANWSRLAETAKLLGFGTPTAAAHFFYNMVLGGADPNKEIVYRNLPQSLVTSTKEIGEALGFEIRVNQSPTITGLREIWISPPKPEPEEKCDNPSCDRMMVALQERLLDLEQEMENLDEDTEQLRRQVINNHELLMGLTSKAKPTPKRTRKASPRTRRAKK